MEIIKYILLFFFLWETAQKYPPFFEIVSETIIGLVYTLLNKISVTQIVVGTLMPAHSSTPQIPKPRNMLF